MATSGSGDPAFAPVLAELNRRKAVIYVHPASPLCCTSLMSYVPPFFSEFQQDTTRTILSLIFSGSISRLPDIRFIFSHAGGTLPMVAGRIEHYSTLPAFKDKVPNGFDYELKRLYYEIANSAYKPSMAAITNMVPTSQIMFGTDFPLVAIDDTANGLRSLGLPAAELQAIARGNALGLFPAAARVNRSIAFELDAAPADHVTPALLSAAINAANSSGVPSGSRSPCLVSRSRTSDASYALRSRALSQSTIERGVPAGAISPNQAPPSNPASPASAAVGTSGSTGLRCGDSIASARTWPDRPVRASATPRRTSGRRARRPRPAPRAPRRDSARG